MSRFEAVFRSKVQRVSGVVGAVPDLSLAAGEWRRRSRRLRGLSDDYVPSDERGADQRAGRLIGLNGMNQIRRSASKMNRTVATSA
jgi:hypothetical protein